MVHFHGPKEWTIIGIAKWAASAILGTVLLVIVEENLRKVAEKKHWDELLWERIQEMPDLSPIYEAHWFWFIFGLSFGLACALWMIKTLIARNTSISPTENKIEYVKTVLRLQFFGDLRNPTLIDDTNVASWYAYYSPSIEFQFRDAEGRQLPGTSHGPTWVIFLAMEKLTAYRQVLISFSNPEKAPPLEPRFQNAKIIVITAKDQIPPGVLEISILE